MLINPASHTTPSPVGPIAANGTITITKLYDEPNHRGIVPANATVTCTVTNSSGATFVINCGRNGTATFQVPQTANAQNGCTVSTNGVSILDITIKQGSTLFSPGNAFGFSLLYNFNEYRSSLAAPDWDKMGVHQGRTPATSSFTMYGSFNLE